MSQNQISKLAEMVLSAVEARGYTTEGLLARQVVKATEELAELGSTIQAPRKTYSSHNLQVAGHSARRAFDDSPAEFWNAHQLDNLSSLANELADTLIPLLAAWAVLEQELGVDMTATLRHKVLSDIGRGVRGKG